MPRGDHRHLVGKHAFGPQSAIAEMKLTIETNDDDETPVISVSYEENPELFDLTVDNKFSILITSAMTVGVPLATYKYAVEIIGYNGVVNTPLRGLWELTDDVVDNAGAAPYLSWVTREDIDTDVTALEGTIDDIGTAFNMSRLTTALVGGENTLVMADTSFLTALDNIRVITDTGYEDEVVSSVDSAIQITISGTVSAASAAGNWVRKL